ncbi:hypothetical protein, partial [Vibrio olivae]
KRKQSQLPHGGTFYRGPGAVQLAALLLFIHPNAHIILFLAFEFRQGLGGGARLGYRYRLGGGNAARR